MSKAGHDKPLSSGPDTPAPSDIPFPLALRFNTETPLDYPPLQPDAANASPSPDPELIWGVLPDDSEGRDSFVYLDSGTQTLPWNHTDSILGFNIADDRIILVSPEHNRLTQSNLHFREDAQQLSIHWQYGEQHYAHHVEIRSHDGALFNETDILKAVQIL